MTARSRPRREDPSAAPPWYSPAGEEYRPDPDSVTTVAELLEAMRLYRGWAGNVPFRTLTRGTLPRQGLVRDFIGACGATSAYLERFEAAWRRVAAP